MSQLVTELCKLSEAFLPMAGVIGYLCSLYVLPPRLAEKANILSGVLKKTAEILDKMSANTVVKRTENT